MRAQDLFKAQPWAKVAICGKSGTGKTTWLSRAPRPLIAQTEAQGLASVVAANPDAHVYRLDVFNDLKTLMAALKTGHEATDPETGQPVYEIELDGEELAIQTLGLDSLTDLQELIKRKVVLGEASVRKPGILREISLQQWGEIQSILRALLRDLRSLPVNVVALTLAVDSTDDFKRRSVQHAIHGQIGKYLNQWFAAGGYAVRKDTDEGVEYGIEWELGDRWPTKRGPGFPAYSRQSMTEPGVTTLGSIVLYAMPGLPVPHVPGVDSADLAQLNDNDTTNSPEEGTT